MWVITDQRDTKISRSITAIRTDGDEDKRLPMNWGDDYVSKPPLTHSPYTEKDIYPYGSVKDQLKDKKEDSKLSIKEFQGGNLFYTYNPYTTQDLDLILKILQIGEPISVSMCGKNFDNDKQQKLKTLSEIFTKFEVIQNYEESGDNYFYTLYTPRKVKVKILTR